MVATFLRLDIMEDGVIFVEELKDSKVHRYPIMPIQDSSSHEYQQVRDAYSQLTQQTKDAYQEKINAIRSKTTA